MDRESPQLPAPLTEHECINCGCLYLDDCGQPDYVEDFQPPAVVSKPMEYAHALVVASFGFAASFSLYQVVEKSFWLLEHGIMLPFDFNLVVMCVCTAFGSIGGYYWARKKGEQNGDNDSR